MKVNHDADLVTGEYQFADSLKDEILYHLKFAKTIGHTNVKASLHTEWGWLSDNQKVKNFKSFIASEIEKNFGVLSFKELIIKKKVKVIGICLGFQFVVVPLS